MTCLHCGLENQQGAAFCSRCGQVLQTTATSSKDAVNTDAPGAMAITTTTDPQMLLPPKRKLFKCPLTSDWIFWLFVAFVVIVGMPTLYNIGQSYQGWGGAALLVGGPFDAIVQIAGAFFLIALVPALIRALTWRIADKRALASPPLDIREGWKPDPLDGHRQRWWNGKQWTRALDPEPSTRVGAASWWTLAGLLVILTAAMFIGYASPSTSEAGSTPASAVTDNSRKPPASAEAVVQHFQNLATAMIAYSESPFDNENYGKSFSDAHSAFKEVKSNYVLFDTALLSITSQDELGPGAPDLLALRNFANALDPWIETRSNLFTALENCGAGTAVQLPGDCEYDAYMQWEQPILDTMPPVAKAFDAVVNSIPE